MTAKTYHVEGRWLTAAEVAQLPRVRDAGINERALKQRLSRGWPISRAMSTPLHSSAVSGRAGAAGSPWRRSR